MLEEDNECIFLLGTKAVGKSALAHYLAGNGLAMEFDEVLGYKKVVLSDGSKQEETIISNLLRFSDD